MCVHNQEIGEPNICKVFGSNKMKKKQKEPPQCCRNSSKIQLEFVERGDIDIPIKRIPDPHFHSLKQTP